MIHCTTARELDNKAFYKEYLTGRGPVASFRYRFPLALGRCVLFDSFFHDRSGPRILSTSHTVKLLENVVGHTTKLDDIAIKPLTPGTWFLTSLVDHLFDGRGTGQPLSALLGLQLNRMDTASPLDDNRPM